MLSNLNTSDIALGALNSNCTNLESVTGGGIGKWLVQTVARSMEVLLTQTFVATMFTATSILPPIEIPAYRQSNSRVAGKAI
ncbi:hypothetical protein GCM10027170_25160 [Aliiglaciecola aliphaticivorans]